MSIPIVWCFYTHFWAPIRKNLETSVLNHLRDNNRLKWKDLVLLGTSFSLHLPLLLLIRKRRAECDIHYMSPSLLACDLVPLAFLSKELIEAGRKPICPDTSDPVLWRSQNFRDPCERETQCYCHFFPTQIGSHISTFFYWKCLFHPHWSGHQWKFICCLWSHWTLYRTDETPASEEL